MRFSRPALLTLLVGLALVASPALLVTQAEPTECANDVEPTSPPADSDSTPVIQYRNLGPNAKRVFDRAEAAPHSVTVTGEQCPERFSYGADRERYVTSRTTPTTA